MGSYSIKELEKLSGIKAHTIRIWEKRHKIISPERSDTNIRTYSDRELKKILNVAILNNHGYKISKIAVLTDDELASKVAQLADRESPITLFIDQLTIAMIDLDEAKFEKLLSNFIIRFGFERTLTEIIYPFLDKIGILWLSDNITPIQEHFISNLIRQKIIVAIDGLNTTDSAKDGIVLFLPENELHEIGLLFFHFIVKSLQFKTYYLGQYTPIEHLEEIVNEVHPKYLITSISHLQPDVDLGYMIEQIATKFPECKLLATGKPVFDLNSKLPKNVSLFKDVDELRSLL